MPTIASRIIDEAFGRRDGDRGLRALWIRSDFAV